MQGTKPSDGDNAAAPFVTVEDHDAGFKTIDITFRNGKKSSLKLFAPDHRTARELGSEIARSKEFTCVVVASLGAAYISALPQVSIDLPKLPEGETHSPVQIEENKLDSLYATVNKWMNRLTPTSAHFVEFVALTLTFGDEYQKKILTAGVLRLAEKMPNLFAQKSDL